ncbi:hypothetical protein IJG93_00530 [Candidatus Saccharibacteria bacterium]|nr:hypothetical protein [Candidatus Saccharibacteria bacterium]
MKTAKKIYNLTMSKISIHDILGATIDLKPVDSFSEPKSPEEGVYYVVENIHEYQGRTDLLSASYAGRTISGTTLYVLKDIFGVDVVLGNVDFGTKPIKNYIPRKDVQL